MKDDPRKVIPISEAVLEVLRVAKARAPNIPPDSEEARWGVIGPCHNGTWRIPTDDGSPEECALPNGACRWPWCVVETDA